MPPQDIRITAIQADASEPQTLLRPLMRALETEGETLGIYHGGTNPFPAHATIDVPEDDDAALIIATSGSTGTPKQTVLTVDALSGSSMGTAITLGMEGQWLLALPTSYIAGIQVLVRSLYAGTAPIVMPLDAKFTPELFTAFAREMTDRTRMTSLVPAQLDTLVSDPSPETLAVLRRFNAILVGGAPIPTALQIRAAELELNLIRTYGSAETAGGCIYDGTPIDGAEVGIEDGAILLGGATIAAGYLENPALTAERFFTDENGTRWYRTDDLGHITDGVLTVTGRRDDVINTGGIKVSAALIQERLNQHEAVAESFVTGTEHPHWGTQVSAAVVLHTPVPDDRLAAWVEAELGKPARPRRWLRVPALPVLNNGKVDRQALITRLREMNDGERPAK